MFRDRHPRLYLWVRWRSVGLHLLFALVATGCSIAAWWQVQRAVEGNILSYFYSVEWPAFVVVAAFGWWQLVHDTDEDIARRRAYHERVRRASVEVVARTLPRSATAITVGSEDLGGRVLPSGAVGELPGPDRVPVISSAGALVVPETPSPEPENGLDDYNRWLALLAVKGKAKTWRNPSGQR